MTDKLVLNTTQLAFGNVDSGAPLHTWTSNQDGTVTLAQDNGQPFQLQVNGTFTVNNNMVVEGDFDIDDLTANTIIVANAIYGNGSATFNNLVIGNPGLFEAGEGTAIIGNNLVVTENSSLTTINGTLSANTVLVDGIDVKDRIINASASTKRYYVKTNGDDAQDGKSWDRAFKTIRAAVAAAPSDSTIYVETGTYTEITPIVLKPRQAIVGDNLRLCILKAVNPRLDYFHVNNLCYLYGLRFVDLQRPAFCCAFPCAIAEVTVQNDTVVSIEVLYSPSGYTSPPPVIIQAPEISSGVQATATAVLTGGVVTGITVTNGGSGYATLRPHVSIPAATKPFITGSPYIQNCSSITGPFTKQVPATKISELTPLPYSTLIVDEEGAGGGCRIDGAVCSRGVVGSVTINAGGTGYTSPPTVVFSDGDATGTATISGGAVVSVTVTNGGSYVNIPTVTFVGGGGSGALGTVVMSIPPSPLRSFVADSFTQVNQGGPGHLIINLGYAQFVSCFTTFCTYSYKAVAGGFTNISTSVTDFGNYGLVSSGYWPIPIATGKITQTYRSAVTSVTISDTGSGVGGIEYSTEPYVLFSTAGYAETKLSASDGATGDGLGTSASISADGTSAIVGAPTKTYGALTAAGALYVYAYAAGAWSQEAKIIAQSPSANAQFGAVSRISGDGTRLVVSSTGDQKVYVYLKSGSNWNYEAELNPLDKSPGDSFGTSLSITADGTRIVVGAPNHDPASTTNAGAAYVFLRSGSPPGPYIWTQEAKLTASDKIANANFGEAVSIASTAGLTVIVGAPKDNPTGNPATLDAGSVYVFTRNTTTWTQRAKVVASSASPSDAFGSAVSISADSTRFVVGAPLRNSGAVIDTGGVYVFTGSEATWTQEAALTTSDKAASDTFGYGVSINSDGSKLVSGSKTSSKGYLFVRAGTTWVQYDLFVATDTTSGDLFGNRGIAINSNTSSVTRIVIGAQNATRGNAYVFQMETPATGTAKRFVSKVDSVIITQGGNYKSTPTVQFISADGNGTGAAGVAKLQAPQIIVVGNATGRKPDVGSVTKYQNAWYTITGATKTGAGTYNVTFYPAIYSTEANDTINFYIASQVSTGGHVTEYIGSGVTYNALPEYGGVPNAGNKYLEITPGKVYFNISDHLGNQDIGKYFAVDQLTGAVTIKTDQFSLSGLVGISFERGGTLEEVSNNPDLISSTGGADSTTVPTQSAVMTYVNRRTIPAGGFQGDALVKYSNVSDYAADWQSVVLTNQKNVTNGVAGLDATGRMLTANLPNTISVSNVYVTSGSAATPSYSFTGRANVGMYTSAANTLNFATSSTDRLAIDPSGNVGIGVSNPLANVHIDGRMMVSGGVVQRGGALLTGTTNLGLYSRVSGDAIKFQTNGGNFLWYADDAGSSSIMQLTSAGSVSVIGDVTAFSSDERLKTNIRVLENPLESLKKLRGVEFDWNPETPQPFRGHDVGLLAQDVQRVIPEAVCPAPFDTNEDGTSKSGNQYLTINAGNRLLALLIESVKHLAQKVEDLEK